MLSETPHREVAFCLVVSEMTIGCGAGSARMGATSASERRALVNIVARSKEQGKRVYETNVKISHKQKLFGAMHLDIPWDAWIERVSDRGR